MNFEALTCKLIRLPIKKAYDIYNMYTKEHELNFADSIHTSNILVEKVQTKRRIKEECYSKAFIALGLMSRMNNLIADEFFEEVKHYPMIVFMEVIGEFDDDQIKSILENYKEQLPSMIIETLILNLSESEQLSAVRKYQDLFDVKTEMFELFYNCLSKDSQEVLKNRYPTEIKDDPLLDIQNIKTESLKEELEKQKDKLTSVSMDDIVKCLLLKTHSNKEVEEILDILEIYKDRLHEISDQRFILLIGRLKKTFSSLASSERKERVLNMFYKLKDRFKTLGLEQTLEILDAKVDAYYQSIYGTEIIYELLDDAYENEGLHNYVNEVTKRELIKKHLANCNKNEYTLEDFERLVKKTTTTKPQKLIYDDYIEAMIACRQLMEKRIISDDNEYFIELRRKFIQVLNDKVEKDGTYTAPINFNGLFYRLIKSGTCTELVNINGLNYRQSQGKINFDDVVNVKTYKGLIYLSKVSELYNDVDYVTQYLTDEQVYRLNMSPIAKWRNKKIKEAQEKKESSGSEEDNTYFNFSANQERLALQLLLYFGKTKAEHIWFSGLEVTRMENIFDTIDYKSIKIDENGKAIVNEEILDFLFGRGSVTEKNSVINRIISGELSSFGQYIPEICNNYEKVKEACRGILTVTRVNNYFDKTELPIKLKPNQYNYRSSLKEMKTTSEPLLTKGIELCDKARQRKYSTIPKVKGKMGDFTYEILDMKSPKALEVGYLSHCCFTVNGVSHSALEHSMASKNGRTFVVYYKGRFLTQSWIWRNGDVVCFDSVEAGSDTHGAYTDNINLVDVYKTAATEILDISERTESEEERVKVVTVGNSDFNFNNLESVQGETPRPQERDVYVYDSDYQYVLNGTMPSDPRYEAVPAMYKDPRKKVYVSLDILKESTDELDQALLRVDSIKYDATGNEEPTDLNTINQLLVGEDWYIKVNKSGEIEAEIINEDQDAVNECKKYAEILGIRFEIDVQEMQNGNNLSKEDVVKQLRLTKLESRR